MWQPQNSISDKTQQIPLQRTIWHHDNWWDVPGAAFYDLAFWKKYMLTKYWLVYENNVKGFSFSTTLREPRPLSIY